MTAQGFEHLVEAWGMVVVVTAAVVEAVALVQRRLASSCGWERWPTISMVFRDDGKQWTIFVYLWGLFGGHWWGPFPRFFGWDFWIWVCTAGGFLGRDIVNRWDPRPVSKRWLFAILLLGVAEGALLWSTGV